MDNIELLCVLLAGAVVALLLVVSKLTDKLAAAREQHEVLWRGVNGLVDGSWVLRVEGTTTTLARKPQARREVDVPVERRN